MTTETHETVTGLRVAAVHERLEHQRHAGLARQAHRRARELEAEIAKLTAAGGAAVRRSCTVRDLDRLQALLED